MNHETCNPIRKMDADYLAVLSHILLSGNLSERGTQLVTALLEGGEIPSTRTWMEIYDSTASTGNALDYMDEDAYMIVTMDQFDDTQFAQLRLDRYKAKYL